MAEEINVLETNRHDSVFNADTFHGKISIIGAGATGSKVAMALASLGVGRDTQLATIEVWDFDTIEGHNIPNQEYSISDKGKYKVDALQEKVLDKTNIKIHTRKEAFSPQHIRDLGNVTFMLTDTMKSRKDVWDVVKKFRATKLWVETRSGPEEGTVYSIEVGEAATHKEYEKTLYSDEFVAEQSRLNGSLDNCGATSAVGSTGDILAGIAVWQFMKWHNKAIGKEDHSFENEVLFCTRPFMITSRNF